MVKEGKIIIADDESSMRDLLGIIISGKFPYLEQEFYKSGDELERRLQQPPGDTRVVLTDNDMKQGKYGNELITSYSQSQWGRVPMILHTADSGCVREEISDKLFCYIKKPSNLPEICSAVESALNHYHNMNTK